MRDNIANFSPGTNGHDKTETQVGQQRLAELFEELRRARSGRSYDTDAVIGVLYLLSRGHTINQISRRTYIAHSTINRWRDIFQDGNILDFFPDIRERMARFEVSLLPAPAPQRRRAPIMLAWEQSTQGIEDRPNPYQQHADRSDETP